MTTNEQDLRALAYLAKRLRDETHGAAKWDEPGLWSVLKKLEGHNLAITIERVTRHAGDADARTPGAIERPFVPDAPKVAGVRYPPKGADECKRHVGEWVDACRICNAPRVVDEEPDDRAARRTERTSNYAEHVKALRALARKEDA